VLCSIYLNCDVIRESADALPDIILDLIDSTLFAPTRDDCADTRVHIK